jgi:predicted phosphodiesterase
VRYALISDIHANLPALEAVLADIAGRANVDATYHLGDLVGYGPWPNETIHRLRQTGIPGAAGNYDSTVAAGYKHCGCRYEDARQEELSHLSFAWTLAQTSNENKAFLRSLPFRDRSATVWRTRRWPDGHAPPRESGPQHGLRP